MSSHAEPEVRLRAMSRELAVTAMAVRMEVSMHATAGSFALSRQRARHPPRLEQEFQNPEVYLKRICLLFLGREHSTLPPEYHMYTARKIMDV